MTESAVDHERLAATFGAFDGWQSAFVVDGRSYGGQLEYQRDDRVDLFFEWVGEVRTILELGSLEGAHSVQLAARPFVDKVICLEGRDENVRRARAVIDALGLSSRVTTECVDLDTADLADFGRVDAIFCAGVLYHLLRPWNLLAQMRRCSSAVFLDTHISSTGHIALNGYHGALHPEHGLDDPFSGLAQYSFWPTEAELARMAADAGFAVTQEEHPHWPNAPRVHLLLTASSQH